MILRKKYSIVGFMALLAAIIGFSVYNYMYQDHRDIASERVDFELESSFLNSVMSNTDSAQKYVDKVIQTDGKITAIEQNALVLDNEVHINFGKGFLNSLTVNDKVTIKGRCVGYDDLLELVKIDQATLVNN
ncbi:hypothetical protein ABN763_15280 [Spongiivirga sp. MCCC 1A20706]|uniref:hypothetical protein n=1 Tax=Spongiivirga sp. MCCC 1A20706 TaxID=3160963 RepID=UPI003977ACE2